MHWAILKWKFLLFLETWLCPVMFFWKLSCTRMFCQSRHLRGCVTFGKGRNITQWAIKDTCIGLPCNTLLAFPDLCLLWLCREKKQQRTSCGVSAASCCFLELLLVQQSLVDSSEFMLVFANWTGRLLLCLMFYPDDEDQNRPQRTTSKQVHIPLCRTNHLSPLPSIGRVKGDGSV